MTRGPQTALVLSLMLVASGVHANGYKILGVKSTKANALGEAFVAQADDPTAVAFNPAGLAQLRGNQITFQTTVCNAYTEHTSPTGEKTDIEDKWQPVPSLFATSDFGRDDLSVGLGLSFPNGLSSEWSRDSFARYVSTFSNLIIADINGAVGWRLADNLLIGAGLNYYSEAELRSEQDAGALLGGTPNGMDVRSRLEADGTAVGGNIGAIWTVTPGHRLAAVYHQGYSIDYDGDLSLAGTKSGIETSIDVPTAVVLGYAVDITDDLVVEFNIDWTDWSSIDDIVIVFDTPGMPNVVQAQGYSDAIAYKVGAEYQCSDALALRCGYIFNEQAIPEANWRPSLPESDTHFLTAGFGYDWDRLTIETAFQLIVYETRTIDNNVDFNEDISNSSIDGTYRTVAGCASVSATYRF